VELKEQGVWLAYDSTAKGGLTIQPLPPVILQTVPVAVPTK